MNIAQALKELGLPKNKTDVYLAVLQMGRGSVQEIAAKCGIARTTVHEILLQLSELGLVGYTANGKTRVYVAESPQKLLTLQDNRAKMIRNILPELELLCNTEGTRPKVRFYDGAEGVKTVFDDTLTASDKVLYGILSMEDLYAVAGKVYMDHYVRRRVRAGIHLNVIRSESKDVEVAWTSSNNEDRDVRYNPSYLIFPMTVYLYDNKVALLGTKKEHFGMIIESPDLYKTMKNFYDILWDLSRKIRPVD